MKTCMVKPMTLNGTKFDPNKKNKFNLFPELGENCSKVYIVTYRN